MQININTKIDHGVWVPSEETYTLFINNEENLGRIIGHGTYTGFVHTKIVCRDTCFYTVLKAVISEYLKSKYSIKYSVDQLSEFDNLCFKITNVVL